MSCSAPAGAGAPAPRGSAPRPPPTSRPLRLRRAAPNTLRRRPCARDSTSRRRIRLSPAGGRIGVVAPESKGKLPPRHAEPTGQTESEGGTREQVAAALDAGGGTQVLPIKRTRVHPPREQRGWSAPWRRGVAGAGVPAERVRSGATKAWGRDVPGCRATEPRGAGTPAPADCSQRTGALLLHL